MKIVVSIKEMAALAGVAKQFDEIINPKDKKRTVQDMITQMINDFKDPEKHGFYSIKMDGEMNLIIECEANAVAKLLGIFKDFVSTMYPLYKAAFECGATFGQRIQEVVDEYTEPEKKEDIPAAVVIVGTEVPKESFEEKFTKQQDIESAWGKMKREREEKEHAESMKKSGSQKMKVKKMLFKCPECGRQVKLNPEAYKHECRTCGNEMQIQ